MSRSPSHLQGERFQAATKRWSLTAACGCRLLPGSGHSAAYSIELDWFCLSLVGLFFGHQHSAVCSMRPPHMRLPMCTTCAQAGGVPRTRSSQTCLHLWSGHAECVVGSPLSRGPGHSKQHIQHRWHRRSAAWCQPMGCYSLTPGHLPVRTYTDSTLSAKGSQHDKYHRVLDARGAYVAILRGCNHTSKGVCCSQNHCHNANSPRSC